MFIQSGSDQVMNDNWYKEDEHGNLVQIENPEKRNEDDSSVNEEDLLINGKQEENDSKSLKSLDGYRKITYQVLDTLYLHRIFATFILFLLIGILYFFLPITIADSDLNWDLTTSSFPLELFSWRILISIPPSYLLFMIRITNISFIFGSVISIFYCLEEICFYTIPFSNLKNHEIIGFCYLACLSYALGTGVWFTVNNFDSTSSFILFLTSIFQLFFIKIILKRKNMKESILAGIISVLLIYYDARCCVFLFTISLSLMIWDSRRDPSFSSSFTFISTVGVLLLVLVILLRISKFLSANNNTLENTSIDSISFLSLLQCSFEGSFGNLISPSRGIFIYSPFLIIPCFCTMVYLVLLFKNTKVDDVVNDPGIYIFIPLITGILLYVIVYSVTQCNLIENDYYQNISLWNGWWGGSQVGVSHLSVIIPTLIILCSSIFFLPKPWRKTICMALIIFSISSILLHFIIIIPGNYHALHQWNTKDIYLCYDENPSSMDKENPFLTISSRNEELALSLKEFIRVDKIEEDIRLYKNKHRMWSISNAPIWSIFEKSDSINNSTIDIKKSLGDYCLKQFHQHLRNEEEKLKQEIRRLNLDSSNYEIKEDIIIKEELKEDIQIIIDEISTSNTMNIKTNEKEKESCLTKPIKQISKFDMEIVNILYIGADGRYNLGDDLLYKQFNDKIGKKLKSEGLGYRITPLRTFPTADPVLSPCNIAKNQIINWNDIDLVVLGGGSCIMDQYLCQFSFTNLERFPNIPIAIWGSGFDDLLLLTGNRNIMGQLRSMDFSSISFLSTSKLVHSMNTLSERKAIFGGVRGNYTSEFLLRMFHENPDNIKKFPSIGEPGLLIEDSLDIVPFSSSYWNDWIEPTKDYIMINFGIATEGETHMYGQNQQSIGSTLDLIIKDYAHKYQIILYATHTNDIKHIQSLEQIVVSMGVKSSQIIVIPFVPNTSNLLHLLKNSVVSISFRYYSSVLSAIAEVPLVSLAYRFKTIEFCDSIGYGDWVVPTDRAEYNSLKNLIDKAIDSKENIKSNAIATYQNRIKENYDNILNDITNYLKKEKFFIGNDNVSLLTSKKILIIGGTTSIIDRFIYQKISNYLITYFQKELNQYCIIDQLALYWPKVKDLEINFEDYDGIILLGLRYPHPAMVYLLEKIPKSVPILLSNCFPTEIPKSSLSEQPLKSSLEIWKSSMPNIERPMTIDYPALLPSSIKSSRNQILSIIENNNEQQWIGIILTEIFSDFPYSDVTDTLRLLSKVIQSLSNDYKIIIFTTEENSIENIQNLGSMLVINNVRQNIEIVLEVWEISLIEQIIQSMNFMITFSDFSSSLCVSNGVSFLQIVSGDSKSYFLEHINLPHLYTDLREVWSPSTLLNIIQPLLSDVYLSEEIITASKKEKIRYSNVISSLFV